MRALEAIKDSQASVAYRVKEDKNLQFMDQDEQVWTETIKGKVRKYNGVRRECTDWEPVPSEGLIFDVWRTKSSCDREIEILSPWQTAVEASPVKRAGRIKQNGSEMMIRTEDGILWDQRGEWFTYTSDKKEYDGWYPLMESHPYAHLELSNGPVKVEDTRPVSTPAKKRRFKKDYEITEVSPEVLTAASTIAEALATSVQSFTTVGDTAAAKECSAELLKLSKSISWLLREDRDKYR